MKSIVFFLFAFSIINAQHPTMSDVSLNPDGSFDDVDFTITNGDASDIYARTLIWFNENKQYEIVVLDKIENERIKFSGVNTILYSFLPSEEQKQYIENFTLEMEIRDYCYTIKHHHSYFSLDGKKVELSLSDIYNGTADLVGDEPANLKKFYEFRVGVVLMNLLMTITTPRDKW